MPLSTAYKEYILEKLHKEYLFDGVIPTSDQLDADLLEYQKTHPDLSLPKSKYLDFNVERGSSSSAEHIKTIAETVSDDISVVVREIYNLAIQNATYYERWSARVKALVTKAKKLEQRVDSLLLMKDQTAGFFATVGDVFSDMNLTDTDITTARVNPDEQTVTLNPGSVDAPIVKQINTSSISSSDISFSPLSGRLGTSPIDITELVNVFKTSYQQWTGRIVATTPGPMSAELKVRVSPESDIEVSKISMDYTGTRSEGSNVSAMYSVDGYTWYLAPCFNTTQTLSDKIVWSFPLTKLRWIKFLFYKPHSDNANTYEYSIQSIRLYGNVYTEDAGNEFYSIPLSALNTNGNITEFSSVSLDVCEALSTGTDIKYYVSASKDESIWTNWADIQPSSRNGIDYPKIVSFGGTTWYNNTNNVPSSLFQFDESISSYRKLTSSFDLSDSLTNTSVYYRFKNNSFGTVNTMIPVASGKDPDIVGTSVVLWRNTRADIDEYPDVTVSQGTYFPRTVRGVPRGWGSDGLIYSCYFEIINSDGRILNFGDTICSIDGQKVSGAVKVRQGIHKFVCDAKYWYDISSSGMNLMYSESDLKAADKLYPFNHKLIIEGYKYPSSFIGERVYSGTDISAEFYATKTSLFDLENNNKGYGYFAVRGVGSYEYESTDFTAISVIVGYNSGNSDYTNELFTIKWRGGDTSENYKYVKLKAELETQDAGLTPVLTSYRLKLGI